MGTAKRGRGGGTSRGGGGENSATGGRGGGTSRGGGGENSATRGRGGRSTATMSRPLQAEVTRPAIQQGITSVEAVLGQPELLEAILDYAIHDQDRQRQYRTLCSVRQVKKTWLTGVSTLMRKNKEPLYKLTLTKDNSLCGTPLVEARGKLLDQFATLLKNQMEQPFPTFSVKILMEFFRRENHHSLVTFLRQYGHGLVGLEMIIPENAGSLPGILPVIKLPFLQWLKVTFSTSKLDASLTGMELSFGHSANMISLIQGILNGAQSLKELKVPPFGPNNIAYPAPAGIEVIILPETITRMSLTLQFTSQELELLITNRLPNLRSLCMLLDDTEYADGKVSKMLTNFSETLRVLCLGGMFYSGPPRHSHLVRFPLMKELTQLVTNSKVFELEDSHPLLSQCLPKIRGLSLQHQTREMFQKWVSNGPLNYVREFSLRLIDENKPATDSLYTLPINLESMQRLHLTFPNIRILTLELSSGEAESCGLKYLFMEMRQLKSLKLKVAGSETIVKSNYWDSKLTGVPISMIAALRENRHYWKQVELNEEVPSIRMLTELQSLTLEAVVSGANGRNLQSLVSELTFTLALLNMPKLVTLRMYGRFKATFEMMKMWKEKKNCRVIILPRS